MNTEITPRLVANYSIDELLSEETPTNIVAVGSCLYSRAVKMAPAEGDRVFDYIKRFPVELLILFVMLFLRLNPRIKKEGPGLAALFPAYIAWANRQEVYDAVCS